MVVGCVVCFYDDSKRNNFIMEVVEKMNVEEMKQEIDRLYAVAAPAVEKFSTYTKEQVETIVQAVVEAAAEKAEFYAEWAVRETGYGNLEAKIAKNLATSTGLKAKYNIADFVEPSFDRDLKMITIPKPAGIVLAPMPCTNPIMTVNFKIIANLVARNSVLLCPHPAAVECCVHASEYLAKVAEEAGAPKGCVQVVKTPNIDMVGMLMKDPRTSLIMATGGPGLVHAAYSSGNPAVGVGAGNVPCYVHETADIAKAGAQIVVGNSFDYGLPCTCESTVLADRAISDELKDSIVAGGGYFVTGVDAAKIQGFLFPEGVNNPAALGKSAQWIGEQAGVNIPEGVLSIVIEIDEIGPHVPVSKEKMFPVLAYYTVDGGIDGAIESAMKMLNMMGKGHSAVVHTTDPTIVAKYTNALPVCRISINSPGITGNAGMTTNLAETGMVGTGFFGGSSSDENIGPQHLIQHTYVAYDLEYEPDMDQVEKAYGV
jgi:acyl-CoA reductase-like NAD-dependent aldehyde dehydrogenase